MTITKRGNAASGWALDFAYELENPLRTAPHQDQDGRIWHQSLARCARYKSSGQLWTSAWETDPWRRVSFVGNAVSWVEKKNSGLGHSVIELWDVTRFDSGLVDSRFAASYSGILLNLITPETGSIVFGGVLRGESACHRDSTEFWSPVGGICIWGTKT